MINIELKKPLKLTTYDNVLNITFDLYNPDLIAIIKNRSIKSYNPNDKSWEVPLFDFKKLVQSLEDYTINYITPIEVIEKSLSIAKENYKPIVSISANNSKKNKLSDISFFSKFSYNKEIIDFLKSNKSIFDSDSKMWEFDPSFLPEFIKKFKSMNYTIKLQDSVDKALKLITTNNEIIEASKSKDWDNILNSYQFKTKPYSYQLEGIKTALSNPNLLLTDEQGLGKTLQAIYAADIKSKEEGYPYTLVVCGVNGLKYNWLSEIEEHLGEEAYILGSRLNRAGNIVEGTIAERLSSLDDLDIGTINNRFIITNIETLRNADIKEKLKSLCIFGKIGMVIIDEIHRVSNIKSAQGDALNYLKSRNKIGLTGTPVINKPFDLYAPLSWLNIEHRSEFEFKHRYGKYVERYGQGRSYEELIEYINLSELKEILSTIMLRREKKDVLDLPDVVYMQETIDLSNEQSKLYNLIKKELVAQIDEIILDPNPLAKFTRLRQACSCSAAIDSSITKNAKYTRVLELIDDFKSANKKVIVYSNFAFAVKELDSLMKANNIKSYTITGDEKHKKAIIDKFKTDGDVLIGSIKALGTGYTITEASNIIFLDLPWTYADMVQAVDRAHRIGQENKVTVISLLAKNTVDEKIYKIVKKKEDLFNDLMEGKDIKGVNRKKLTKRLLGIE